MTKQSQDEAKSLLPMIKTMYRKLVLNIFVCIHHFNHQHKKRTKCKIISRKYCRKIIIKQVQGQDCTVF